MPYHSLTIAQVRPETRDAVVVSFAVPHELREAFHYAPGQHVNLRARIEGQEVRRSYSICAPAQGQQLRIAIKRAPGGVFSNWAIEHLRPGMALDLMPPAGRFHLPLDAAARRRYLAIAAGSGITPILSLLATTLDAEPRSECTLFYGNRASSSILFRDELADLKDMFLQRFTLVHIMSREHQDLDLLNGRITAEKLPALLHHFVGAEVAGPNGLDAVFLCGPDAMNRELAGVLEAAGVPAGRILSERFASGQTLGSIVPSIARPAPAAASGEATLILDGRRHQFPYEIGAETILDAGLRAGLDLRFSCKSGVCATCRAKLLQGQVDMDGNFALEDYEIARGFILTCQSYPVTDRVVVDFDQDS